MLSSKLLANLFGLAFIFAGLLGFVPNPLVAPDGVFAVNTMHNLVHIVTGVAFLAGGYGETIGRTGQNSDWPRHRHPRL